MIIEIKQPYGKWVPGHKPDVLGHVGIELIQRGIATLADDQTRQDLPPKKAEEEKEQAITVNNYYVMPEAEQEEPKRKPRKK